MARMRDIPPGVPFTPVNRKKTIKKLFDYLGKSKKHLLIVVVFLIISSLANVLGMSLLPGIINDYIAPAFGTGVPLGAEFYQRIGLMILVYLVGVVATSVLRDDRGLGQ